MIDSSKLIDTEKIEFRLSNIHVELQRIADLLEKLVKIVEADMK